MKTSKELADELDAEDRLFGRGYSKEKCTHCNGTGSTTQRNYPGQCYHCDGKGFNWKAPLLR